jgi:hypothetical protein
MSDNYKPTHEELSNVTLEEFSDFLSSKGISSKCKVCSEGQIVINLSVNAKKDTVVSLYEAPVVNVGINNAAAQYFTAVCSNCFASTHFNALAYMRAKNSKGPE